MDTRQWTKGEAMLKPRTNLTACKCGDYIYAFGGQDELKHYTNNAERYSIAKNEWTAISLPPASVAEHCACAALPDRRYIALISRAGIDIYDTISDKWHRLDSSKTGIHDQVEEVVMGIVPRLTNTDPYPIL